MAFNDILMKKTILRLASLLLLGTGLNSCEDVISIETNSNPTTQLSIDAWITDESKVQTVRLTLTQPYFDQTKPRPATGATVVLVDQDSTLYPFTEKQPGEYVWTPSAAGQTLVQVGGQYALYVSYQGEEYVATSRVNRVPPIDSINYFKEKLPIAPPDDAPQEGYQADFYARDLVGPGDCYWIRAYRNDTLFNKPSQIQVAYDGGFSQGGAADGFLFILPLRASITPELYQANDRVRVELYSITLEAFYFLQIVRTESTNGGIFATVPGNIPSNFQNLNAQSQRKALGFFGTSAVSTFATTIDPNKAIPKPPSR